MKGQPCRFMTVPYANGGQEAVRREHQQLARGRAAGRARAAAPRPS